MKKISIDFGNIVKELQDKNLKMFVRKSCGGVIYIENNNGEFYGANLVCVDGSYRHFYLDDVLEKKITVEFNKVEDSSGLWEWDREYYDFNFLEEHIKFLEKINDPKWIIELRKN